MWFFYNFYKIKFIKKFFFYLLSILSMKVRKGWEGLYFKTSSLFQDTWPWNLELRRKNLIKSKNRKIYFAYDLSNNSQVQSIKPPSAPGLIFSRFFYEILMVALKKYYYFPRNYGPDPPYVAVFPDPSVAASLKSARENSSALESRVSIKQ